MECHRRSSDRVFADSLHVLRRCLRGGMICIGIGRGRGFLREARKNRTEEHGHQTAQKEQQIGKKLLHGIPPVSTTFEKTIFPKNHIFFHPIHFTLRGKRRKRARLSPACRKLTAAMTLNVYPHVMDDYKRKEAAKFTLFPVFMAKMQKKTRSQNLAFWRREEDSNLRTSHPRHTISNRAP